ncbi:MAG: hypothetical protein ACI87W_000013 [Halieaceae bacterium]
MNEDDIREFLVENPDYFQRNPELLGLLQIPHASGAAVSLVERQVSVLRDRNVDLRHRLRDLGSTARDNDQLFADTRQLVLALLPSHDLSAAHGALMGVLRDNFDIEYASLTLFDEASAAATPWHYLDEAKARAMLGAILGRGNAGCAALRADQFAALFPQARLVGSAAVALIEADGRTLGLLAVGSSNSAHYGSDMGTVFLQFAAEVMGQLILRFEKD